MTTIATDGTTICADSLRTFGNERCLAPSVKIEVAQYPMKGEPVIYARTEHNGFSRAAIEWHRIGAHPSDCPKGGEGDSWTLIVIDKHGLRQYTADNPYGEDVPYPHAWGSGCEYAMGAMLAGASAEKGIEIASRLNIYTGGPIQVIDIAQTLGVNLPMAAE